MRRGKRPAAGGTGPGLPGPAARAVGMPTTQPPRKPLSLPTHLAWDVLPDVAPDVTRGLSWAMSAGRPSGCGSRGRRGQAGGAARCWCGVPDAGGLGAQNGYIKGCSLPRAGGVGFAYGSPTRL